MKWLILVVLLFLAFGDPVWHYHGALPFLSLHDLGANFGSITGTMLGVFGGLLSLALVGAMLVGAVIFTLLLGLGLPGLIIALVGVALLGPLIIPLLLLVVLLSLAAKAACALAI